MNQKIHITNRELELLNLFYKWKYLSSKQIQKLMDISQPAAYKIGNSMIKKGLIRSTFFGIERVYLITQTGCNLIDSNLKRKIKINWNEFKHQNVMIDYVTKIGLSNTDQYEIDIELKKWNFKNSNSFLPDIIYIDDNDREVYVEVERTKKSKKKLEDKIIKMSDIYFDENCRVEWVVDSKEMEAYLTKFFNEINYSYISEKNNKIIKL